MMKIISIDCDVRGDITTYETNADRVIHLSGTVFKALVLNGSMKTDKTF